MRNYDLTPLYRSTIGFDRMANLLDNVLSSETNTPSYPPYNIEKTDDHAYRISIAVAGFSEDDLTIETRNGQLLIKGARLKTTDKEDSRVFLHRGIAERSFERIYQLADHVKVTGATLENGLLHVDLLREVPEELRPREIKITSTAHKDTQLIDA